MFAVYHDLTLHFTGIPSIVKLDYNSSSQTLTCSSAGGPPTTVTWKKNGWSLMIDGTTYQQSQRVINQTDSTYDNLLHIKSNLDNAMGNYSCSVRNSRSALESNSTNFTINGIYCSNSTVRTLCYCFHHTPFIFTRSKNN